MTNFEIKDRIDNVIFKTFNILSDVILFFRFDIKRLIKSNIKYKDIHKGKRCFIIGTGPSLNQLSKSEIDFLKNEIVFGANSFYKADIVDSITPNYYALFDNLYWNDEKHFFEDINTKYSFNPPVFLTDYRSKKILDNINFREAIFLYSKKIPVNKINVNLGGNMYIGQNVINSSIMIAMYMGFKEIYLLGCDYNSFATEKPQHCYEDSDEMVYNTENLAFYLKFYALTTKIHYLIAKFAMKRGTQVVNLTKHSLLDAYPKNELSVLFINK